MYRIKLINPVNGAVLYTRKTWATKESAIKAGSALITNWSFIVVEVATEGDISSTMMI